MASEQSTPWPRERMERHIAQVIREYADIAYRFRLHDDGETEVFLREDGEHRMWERIQAAIAYAGWRVIPR